MAQEPQLPNPKDYEWIGAWIKDYRKAANKMTQKEFGDKIALGDKQISSIEQGVRNLGKDAADKAFKVLNLPADWRADWDILVAKEYIPPKKEEPPPPPPPIPTYLIALVGAVVVLIMIALVYSQWPSPADVTFSWDPSYEGGSIKAVVCTSERAYWISSEEVSPKPRFLGLYAYNGRADCDQPRYPAIGVVVDDVIRIGIGSGATQPNPLPVSPRAPGLPKGTRFYEIRRTGDPQNELDVKGP